MVIRILQSTANIEAVNYSDEKIEKNEAKLLKAENFPFQDMSAQEHKKYLEAVGKLNPRVKKKQFHASISTKGRQHSFEELTQVAERYLRHMGYEKNPYIIYAHHDSPNNHVHIVSSRVGLDGKKISDSLEKKRSQDFIRYDLKIDFSKDVDNTTEHVLSYSLSTRNQFEHLMKKQGYGTKLKGNEYHIYKSGTKQFAVELEKVDRSIRDKKDGPKQSSKIKALLHKYSISSSHSELKAALHQKFGLEVIWHYAKKTESKWEHHNRTPFGFTLIDHKNKTAYKGSELVPLKILHKNFEKNTLADRSTKVEELLHNETSMSIKQYKAIIGQKGFRLEGNKVKDIKSKETAFTIPQERMDLLSYHQRVHNCNRLLYGRFIRREELSQMFKIEVSDVQPKTSLIDLKTLDRYRNLLLHVRANGNTDLLKQSHIHLFNHNEQGFLLDRKANILLNIEKDLRLSKTISPTQSKIPITQNRVSKQNKAPIYFDTSITPETPRRKKRKRTDLDNEPTL